MDELPESAVEKAATAGDVNMVRELLHESRSDVTSDAVVLALQSAAMASQWEVVKYLVDDAFCDVRTGDTGAVVLQYAALAGQLDIVSLILRRGDVAGTAAGSNALRAAASLGRIDIIDCLAQHGADVAATGGAAACTAAWAGHWEVVKHLIAAEADIACDGTGCQLLAYAIDEDKDEIAKLLQARGVDVQSAAGTAAILHMSVPMQWGTCRGAVRQLVELGVSVKSEGGAVALVTAATYGDLEMLKLLLDHGADASSESGSRALTDAGLLGPPSDKEEVVKLLVQHGAVALPARTLELDDDF